MSRDLTTKELKFCKEMLKIFFDGKTKDEEGIDYTIVYRFELYEFLTSINEQLSKIIELFGEYYVEDIEKVMALSWFGDTADINIEKLEEVAYLFDEMFGDEIAPKFSYPNWTLKNDGDGVEYKEA